MALGILSKGQEAAALHHVSDAKLAVNWCGARAVLPWPEAIQAAKMCLADNGIEADETETVLEALCYILLDVDIT